MMRKLISILCLVILVLLIGCNDIVYSPKGSYFKEIPEPQVDIVLTIKNGGELLKAWGNVKLLYEIDTKSHELLAIDLYVDGDKILSTKNPDSILFNTRSVNDGIHQMRLEMRTHTNTGSLADKMNKEYMIYYVEWKMEIHNSVPSVTPQIQKVEVYDGRVRVTWSPYNYANFQSISIYDVTQTQGNRRRATFSSYDPGFWIDSSFVGGQRGYYLILTAGNETVERNSIKEISVDAPVIVSMDYVNTTGIKLQWKKPQLYNNFYNYQIQYATDPPFGVIGQDDKYLDFHTIVTQNIIEDTICIIQDIGFGNAVRYRVVFGESDGRQLISPSTTFYLGERCPEMRSVLFSQTSNSYYLIHTDGWSYHLDANTFQELDCVTNMSFTVAPDLSYAYCIGGRGIYQLDPVTFDTLSYINVYQDINSSVTRIKELVAGGAGRVFFSGWNYNYFPIAYYGYDFSEQKTIGEIKHVGPVERFVKASQNGSYGIFESGIFWKFADSSAQQIGKLDPDYCCFIEDGEKIVRTSGNYLQLLQSNDLSVISEFYTGKSLLYPTYDSITACVGGQSGNHYYIYNLQQQQLIKTVQLCLYSLDQFYFSNSVLFSKWGYFEKIQIP